MASVRRNRALNLKPLVFLVPSLAVATFSFAAFGTMGLCGMTACLGSGNPDVQDVLLGVVMIVMSAIPLVASAYHLFVTLRAARPGVLAYRATWAAALLIGALGAFLAVTDPGDAYWAGQPLIGYSVLLSLSLLTAPAPLS